jgi:hypothetical protein
MFEPNLSDAHKGRQDALKEEYRADSLSPKEGDRLDTTSVRARRALRESQSADTPKARPAEQVNPPAARAEKALPGTGGPSPLAADGAGRFDADGPMFDRHPSSAGDAGCRRAVSADRPQPASLMSAGLETTPVQTQAVGGETAAAASAVTPVRSNGPPSGSLAHQVAQVLSVGRAGEVESLRAPTSSPAPEQGRPSSQDQKSADRTAPDKPLGDKAAARPADDAEAAARSAFDRLVRSIRLRTGTHHSSARLHLDPPELGRMLVDIRLAGDELRIDVRTETSQARELLYERAAQLRAALEQHGIQVGRFEVTGDLPSSHPDSPATADGFQPAAGDGKDHRRTGFSRSVGREVQNEAGVPDGGDGISEVTVVGERRLDVRI